jgi:hypothetical protein
MKPKWPFFMGAYLLVLGIALASTYKEYDVVIMKYFVPAVFGITSFLLLIRQRAAVFLYVFGVLAISAYMLWRAAVAPQPHDVAPFIMHGVGAIVFMVWASLALFPAYIIWRKRGELQGLTTVSADA